MSSAQNQRIAQSNESLSIYAGRNISEYETLPTFILASKIPSGAKSVATVRCPFCD
jgi:hypothetical protein